MNNTQSIRIRTEVNPETAQSFGFVWWKDTIYDPEAPIGAMDDILTLLQEGYILGLPATPDGEVNNFVGLYKKI